MQSTYTSVIDKKKGRLKRQILLELYRNHTSTIAKLSHKIHTSVPSTTSLIDELIDTKWVKAIGIGESAYGRKPSLFALNKTYYVSVILDITQHDTKLFLCTITNEIIEEINLDTILDISSSHFLEELQNPINKLVQLIKKRQFQLIGVGVTLPGLVEKDSGFNYTYPNLNLSENSLTDLLKNCFQVPVYFINDTQATIMGEHWFGLAQGKNNVMTINIDWGVGLGVMVEGRILLGSSGFAGELGHIQMQQDGELCLCGKYGCLDTLASANALLKKAVKGLQSGVKTKLSEIPVNQLTIEDIIEKYSLGDTFSIALLDTIGEALGRGLAVVIHLFNPELIIINGVLAKASEAIIKPIERTINTYCLENFLDNLSIRQSTLGDRAKLFGTQTYVYQRLLQQELIP